jgi:hypothetical protein
MTNNRICSTESRIEDRCKDRSSSEDGIDQLFFGQFAPGQTVQRRASHQQSARGLPDEGLPLRSRRPCAGEGLQRQLLLWVLPQQSLFFGSIVFEVHVSQMFMDALLKWFED